MEKITISIQTTSNPTILKFQADQFLTNHESFEFNNIDEAKASPLAQQLFYLPFIKKVYISGNFIALERFDIVEWADVQDEVAAQIEQYINDGNLVVTEEKEKKKVPSAVYAESTPNPSVLAIKKLFWRMLQKHLKKQKVRWWLSLKITMTSQRKSSLFLKNM